MPLPEIRPSTKGMPANTDYDPKTGRLMRAVGYRAEWAAFARSMKSGHPSKGGDMHGIGFILQPPLRFGGRSENSALWGRSCFQVRPRPGGKTRWKTV